MSEEVDNTQSRPPVQKTRRQRAGSQARTGAGGKGAGAQSRKGSGSRRTQRPASADGRGSSQGSAQGARRSGSSRGQGGAQANRRPQRDQAGRIQGRAAQGKAPQGRTSQGNKPASHARAEKSGPITVPLVPMLLILVVCVVSTVFITRYVVTRQLGAAQATANATATQVEELSKTVEQPDSKATATQSSTSSTSQTTSSVSGEEQTQASAKGEDDKGKDTAKSSSSAGGVEDPWVSSGTYTTGDATLDEEVKAFCDSRADKSMSLDTAALEVYKGIAWSEYVERDDAQHPAGKDWRIEYARKYYEHDCSGNCYEFAAFLMYCLQYLGYEDAMAQGVLIELQSGGWGDHGIVYVTNTDGSSCLCDTSRGTDGWMLSDGAYNVQIQDFDNA